MEAVCFFYELIKFLILKKRMRDEFILMSLDGPYSNVLKFKPPLVFNKQDAAHLLKTLDKVLKEVTSKSRL